MVSLRSKSHKHKIDARQRRIVVINPRVGQGPDIGGSQADSEISLALSQGHPIPIEKERPMARSAVAERLKEELRLEVLTRPGGHRKQNEARTRREHRND